MAKNAEIKGIVDEIKGMEWKYLKLDKSGMFVAGIINYGEGMPVLVCTLDKIFCIKDEQGYFEVEDYKSTFFSNDSECDIKVLEEVYGVDIVGIRVFDVDNGGFEGVYWYNSSEIANKLSDDIKADIENRMGVVCKFNEYKLITIV